LLLGGVLLAIAIAPGSAGADGRYADPLSLGAIPPQPSSGPVRDRVIEGERPELRGAGPSPAVGVFQDQDGHAVRVRVSPAYADPQVRAQELVNFLGSLLHAGEMNDLTVALVTPAELRTLCGVGAIACYHPDSEQIIVSGEDSPAGQPPREFVIAHEYGHHVATNRSNKPWRALERGTKRWSTYEGICRGIKRRRIQPGSYFENPGEAFAEAFAFYRFPHVIPWMWEIARPDQGSFDAIFADVGFPWARRTRLGWSGRLTRKHRREVREIEVPLDGRLTVELDGPSGSDFALVAMAAKRNRVLTRAQGRGPDKTLRYTVCGKRRVRIMVRRVKGGGPFEITAARP
jgi:hypothetical protein